jgi:hypothetical protein
MCYQLAQGVYVSGMTVIPTDEPEPQSETSVCGICGAAHPERMHVEFPLPATERVWHGYTAPDWGDVPVVDGEFSISMEAMFQLAEVSEEAAPATIVEVERVLLYESGMGIKAIARAQGVPPAVVRDSIRDYERKTGRKVIRTRP